MIPSNKEIGSLHGYFKPLASKYERGERAFSLVTFDQGFFVTTTLAMISERPRYHRRSERAGSDQLIVFIKNYIW